MRSVTITMSWSVASGVFTRPALTCVPGALGELLEDRQRIDVVIDLCKEMVRLNPNDSQGIRGGRVLVFQECTEEVEQLLDRFEDEGSAAWKEWRARALPALLAAVYPVGQRTGS